MRRFLLLILVLFAFVSVKAEVANPEPAEVAQPDGTTLWIQLHGDEFSSHTTTLDGYTVVKCADKAYRYAVVTDGELVVTDILAHNATQRDTREMEFCQSQPTHQFLETQQQKEDRNRARDMHRLSTMPDRTNFRGLIILVNYKDCTFSKANPQQLINDMVNKEGYNGYLDEDEGWQDYTGSMHDYFVDSSMGTFSPEFDVVGPVNINYSMYDQNRTANTKTLIKAALKAADPLIDYTRYDGNGDGVVDMFYMMFAGYSSSSSGNDERLLWPHASYLSSTTTILDGMKFSRYACSTSMYGWNTEKRHDNVLCGIGTMCHEFSHVLGLRDHYDTDGNGTIVPATWDVMSSGNHNNKGRTPVAYNMFERYTLGMAQPEVINQLGDYTLPELTQSNKAYMLHSGVHDEYFIIENRQQLKWDASMAGKGMLVWRVDSSDVKQWDNNKVNTDPEHPMFQLLRAKPKWNSSRTSITDSTGDPFPGSGRVGEITNGTDPSLMSWNGAVCPYIICRIEEHDDVITFELRDETSNIKVEDFSAILPFDKTTDETYTGNISDWRFIDACVQKVEDHTLIKGNAATIYKGGKIISSPFELGIESISLSVANNGTLPAIVNIFASNDDGITWTQISKNVMVASKKEEAISLSYVNIMPEARLMIQFQSGSTSQPVYVDNIRIVESDKITHIESIDMAPLSPRKYLDKQGIRIRHNRHTYTTDGQLTQ